MWRSFVAVGCAAVLLGLVAGDGAAARRFWSTNGPFGGTVRAIANHPTDPSTIYVGTTGGVFKTTNAGQAWHRASSGMPPQTEIRSLAVATSQPSTVYAGTQAHGLYRSRDGGASWMFASPGVGTGTVPAIAVSLADPNVVLLSSGASTWRSADGGDTWTQVFANVDNSITANDIAFAPSTPNRVYAGGTAFYRSEDGGVTWSEEELVPPHFNAVDVHPMDPDTFYAGNLDGTYKSTDGGQTFTLMHDLPSLDQVTSLSVDPDDPSTVYSSAYVSGVRVSTDDGQTWERAAGGFDREVISWDVSAAPGSRRVDLALSHIGFFTSSNVREGWDAANSGLVASGPFRLATPLRGGSSIAYAVVPIKGFARSDDGGRSWSITGLAGKNLLDVAVSPRSGREVFVAASEGVFRSRDGGRTWKRTLRDPDNGFSAVAIARTDPSRVYAGGFGGLYVSRDRGRTWDKISRGFSEVYSLAVHPRRASTVIAGTSSWGIQVSTNTGRSWKVSDMYAHAAPKDIEIDPERPERMYASSSSGAHVSDDGGMTWDYFEIGAQQGEVSDVEVDPTDSRIVYAGAFEVDEWPGGVFRSTDRGRTWTRISDGLTSTWVNSLAVSSSGSRVYAGTGGLGIGGGGGGVFVYQP